MNPASLGVVTDTKTIAERLRDNYQTTTVIITDGKEQQGLFAIAKATSGTNNFYGKYMFAAVPKGLIVPTNNTTSSMILLDNTLIVSSIEKSQLESMSPLLGYLLVKQYFPRRAIKAYPKVVFMEKDAYREFRRVDAQKKIVRIDTEIEKVQVMISSLSASLKTTTKQKRATQKLLAEYQYYETYFQKQKEQMQGATEHIPNELGVFKSPDTITIVFSPESRQGVTDYLAMFVHEYLHYASFVSEKKRFASSFFEEALTEYFSRSVIRQSFSTKTNLGYPLQVKILTEMTKMFTDSELAEIYFTKDEEVLVHALNRVYGDNFYEENYILFETLQYTSDPKQALELANIIMAKIGGKLLTEEDFVSSFTP